MAHRVLTPSSPYVVVAPSPSSSPAKPSPTKAPAGTLDKLMLATGNGLFGKENTSLLTAHGARAQQQQTQPSRQSDHYQYANYYTAAGSAYGYTAFGGPSAPPSPRLANSPTMSSPQVSPVVAAAPAPTYNNYASRQLPAQQTEYHQDRVQHYHRPTGYNQQPQSDATAEPTVQQLLAEQPTSLSHYQQQQHHRIDRDSTMAPATGLVSWRKGQGFKEWEKQKLASAEVKRKADLAQLYFYDHYFDLLSYIGARKARLGAFKQSVAERNLPMDQAQKEWTSYTGRERVLLRKRRTKLKLDQFHIVTQVGQGGYGEVYLARHKETNQVVALKKMRKKTLLKMDEIRHVLTERDILASTNSPWLVRLLFAFQDHTYVYLAMDFIAGGDFRTLLNNSGVLKEEHARFYITEMFVAVDSLHKLGYIHRDLKPENFLIDTTGHIKLTDFGLASGALNPGKIEHLKHKLDEVKDSDLVYRSTVEMKSIYKSIRQADLRYADSVVGSPDYMAIETLRGHTYTFSVDYWSLGCILFEFLSGFPPFSGASAEETWANLKNWQKCLRRPHYDRPEDRIFNLSDEGWHAITAKEQRVSSLKELQLLPFFQGIDWATLRDRKAPFIPSLDSEVDAGYFDDFNNEADMAKYAEVREKQRNVDKVREKDDGVARSLFVGFTFKARDAKAELLPADRFDGFEEEDELETLF
ncbi:serine/threonine-protein kinase dbf2 [Microbotryomycetes sp. JL201]|nr:serine/threonine-protein kinase dbf2 [Microbotryomycetes sp. JL201]